MFPTVACQLCIEKVWTKKELHLKNVSAIFFFHIHVNQNLEQIIFNDFCEAIYKNACDKQWYIFKQENWYLFKTLRSPICNFNQYLTSFFFYFRSLKFSSSLKDHWDSHSPLKWMASIFKFKVYLFHGLHAN